MPRVKIPAALKFLITRRAYLAGEGEKVERSFAKRLEDTQALIVETAARLEGLKIEFEQIGRVAVATREARIRDLAAVDQVIRLHPLQIDPTEIRSIRSHDVARRLPRGNMTRGIYEYLATARGQKRGVTETTVFIITKFGLALSDDEFEQFRTRVRHRMKNMALQNRIVRFRSPSSNVESWFALAPADHPVPKTIGDDQAETATHHRDENPANSRATTANALS